jgi:hypothetical protein
MPAVSTTSVPWSREKRPSRSATSNEMTSPGEPVSSAMGAVTPSLNSTGMITRRAEPSLGTYGTSKLARSTVPGFGATSGAGAGDAFSAAGAGAAFGVSGALTWSLYFSGTWSIEVAKCVTPRSSVHW